MVDTRTKLRMQMLARDARFMVHAFYHQATESFLLLPQDEVDRAKFKTAVEDALNRGAILLGSIALMNRAPEGQALIEYELMPGAPEEAMQRARAKFRDNLIEAGVLKLDTTDTAQG